MYVDSSRGTPTLYAHADQSQLIFQMTIRMATCRELAEDPAAIEELTRHYWNLEKSATPVALLLPWFNGSAKKLNKSSTIGLYTLILKYVEDKRKGSTAQDPIDIFIQDGMSNEMIVGVSFQIFNITGPIKFIQIHPDGHGDNFRWGYQHRRELCVSKKLSSNPRLSKPRISISQHAGPSCT